MSQLTEAENETLPVQREVMSPMRMIADLERQLAERDERIRVLTEALEMHRDCEHVLHIDGSCKTCHAIAALAEPADG